MLIISPKTVEGHRGSLMSKLNLHDRIDLVKYAPREGYLASVLTEGGNSC